MNPKWRWALCGLVLAAGLSAGCSGSNDDEEDPVLDGLGAGDAGNPLAAYFPDGLHPNSKANDIIAGQFAKHIPSAGKSAARNGADAGGDAPAEVDDVAGLPDGDDAGGDPGGTTDGESAGGAQTGGGDQSGGGDGGAGGGTSPPAGNTGSVVCLGDSITQSGYPDVLARRTGRAVINAGIAGEASGRGAQRVEALLSTYRPSYLCVLYGANDVIGGKATPQEVAANLESIVRAARANGTVVIVGTLTPMSGRREPYANDARAVSAAIRSMVSRSGARLADLEKAF